MTLTKWKTGRTANARSKYGNKKVEVDGIKFDSKKEAQRWGVLRLLEKAGHVQGLRRQVTFPLVVNGIKICSYRADFVYTRNGKEVVEDAKGFITPEFKLKQKLMAAVHGIEIQLI